MKKSDFVKKILTRTCVYYTFCTFFILFLYWAINRDLSAGVRPFALVMMLPFALAFAAANVIWRFARFGRAPKLALHFLLTVGGAWVFLYLPNKDGTKTVSQSLVLLLVLTLLYAAVMGVILIVGARTRKLSRDEAEYTGVYQNKE